MYKKFYVFVIIKIKVVCIFVKLVSVQKSLAFNNGGNDLWGLEKENYYII